MNSWAEHWLSVGLGPLAAEAGGLNAREIQAIELPVPPAGRPEQLNRGTFFSNITNLASLPRDIQKKAPSSRAR